jgi:hypothetical protein
LTIILPKKDQQEKAHRIQIRGTRSGQKNIEGRVSKQPAKETKDTKSADKK